ncbi:MAG: hypothetical protein ACHQK9_05180 [Reyranellales bacterium]
MLLRSLVALTVLALHLGGCAVAPNNKAAVEEMERRHQQEMLTMGGGGSM